MHRQSAPDPDDEQSVEDFPVTSDEQRRRSFARYPDILPDTHEPQDDLTGSVYHTPALNYSSGSPYAPSAGFPAPSTSQQPFPSPYTRYPPPPISFNTEPIHALPPRRQGLPPPNTSSDNPWSNPFSSETGHGTSPTSWHVSPTSRPLYQGSNPSVLNQPALGSTFFLGPDSRPNTWQEQPQSPASRNWSGPTPTSPSAAQFRSPPTSHPSSSSPSGPQASHGAVNTFSPPIRTSRSNPQAMGRSSPISRSSRTFPSSTAFGTPRSSYIQRSPRGAPAALPPGPNPRGRDRRVTGSARRNPPEDTASPERRAYHPKPPPGGSEWVMWVGNIPNDATQEEAMTIFNDMSHEADPHTTSSRGTSRFAPPTAAQASTSRSSGRRVTAETEETGVISVFLILQSHCAFVNYETQAQLQRALKHFHGRHFRPSGLKMVCRPRPKNEEMKSGVGAQRGLGLHRTWVKEHIMDVVETPVAGPSSSVDQPPGVANIDHPVSPTKPKPHKTPQDDPTASPSESMASSSSDASSSRSTTSSLLARYFPTRYFVLKAMTKGDLQLSVGLGFWATQTHNEYVLNQAYRTSKDVYLIFGANKAGEFHGYARMEGPVPPITELSNVWRPRDSLLTAQRAPTAGLPTTMSPFEQHLRRYEEYVPEPQPNPRPPQDDHVPSDELSASPFSSSPTYAPPNSSVNRQGPITAAGPSASSSSTATPTEDTLAREWGVPFRVKWIHVKSMPFHQTRALRNPWNKDREVKVSRDGTELEPSVGAALLDLWKARATPEASYGEDHIVA